MRLTAPIRLTTALGRTLDQGAPTRPAPVAARTRRRRRKGGLTAVVSSRPGITVAQAAEQLGVPATALYPVIRRDTRKGRPLCFARQVTRDAPAGQADSKSSLWSGRLVGR